MNDIVFRIDGSKDPFAHVVTETGNFSSLRFFSITSKAIVKFEIILRSDIHHTFALIKDHFSLLF